MQKFLTRSLFLILLLSAAESWALPECPKKGFLTGTNKRPFLRFRRVSPVHQTVVNLRFNTALAQIAPRTDVFDGFHARLESGLITHHSHVAY